MATYSYINIEHPEGRRLCDLTSIHDDFRRCRDMCAILTNRESAAYKDLTLLDGLATAIPIVYARPFNGGIRIRVNEIPDACYSQDEKQHHENILNLRSKHIAHSVNRMEYQNLRVWLNPTEKGRAINNVNAEHSTTLALSPAEYKLLEQMAQKAYEWVDHEMDLESERLKELITAGFPLDDLYQMEAISPTWGSLNDAHKSRPQR